MEIRFEQVPDRKVAFYRHVGPYPECGPTWQKLMECPQVAKVRTPETVALGIGHDDPNVTPDAECRYDACVTVDDSFAPEGDLQVQDLPGGKFVVATHRGSYMGLGETYGGLRQWVQDNAKQLRPAPCFEVYVNDMSQVAVEELITDIYFPIE